jgi:hypothetical protein
MANYVRTNDESRARLRALIARLDRDQLTTTVIEGWSVSALLAHLAFWDSFTLRRLQGHLAGTKMPDLGSLTDPLNDAALPIWSALPPETAARQVTESANAIDAFVAALAPDAMAQVLAEGRARWISRSLQRMEHLEEIERALGR